MINTLPCSSCGAALGCVDDDPLSLYTLEGPTFLTLNCPDGYVCNRSTFIRMICCGEEFADVFKNGSTDAARLEIITGVVNRCKLRQESCGGGVSVLFYNIPIELNGICAVGSYTLSLPAGTFLASTQDEANAEALAYAREYQKRYQFCVSVPTMTGACVGDTVDYSFRITGGQSPFAASVLSGALPDGLDISVSGAFAHITGTITAMGTFSATIQVADRYGGKWKQAIEIEVLC